MLCVANCFHSGDGTLGAISGGRNPMGDCGSGVQSEFGQYIPPGNLHRGSEPWLNYFCSGWRVV